MSKIEEIIKVLEMGMSDDIETEKLAESLIKDIFPEIISYRDFCIKFIYAPLDWTNEVYDYYWFHMYIIYICNQYFPRLIYSPWTKTFKEYVGS